jgi:hypothetical protein
MLWRVNESSVFRFLKLIGMSNSEIGQCTKLVSERNDAAHSNGNIYLRGQRDLDQKIDEILRSVEVIQTHSDKAIKSFYEKFLLASIDPENREFIDEEDQIREILVYGNYLSQRDIQTIQKCRTDHIPDDHETIASLVSRLQEMYPNEQENA